MVTRQIPSGLSSVLFHICKTRFVGWISSLLTYLLGKTFTVAPKSIWNLTFRRLDIFFVDVFTWQNIYGCTAVDMELNGLLVDKHLCVYFTFRDAVDSSCHLWFRGHAIQEFFLAGFVFFKFNIVCFLSCSALGREVVFFPHAPQIRPQAAQLVLPLRCFRPQKSHGLSLVLSSLGFRFGLSRPVCFGYLRSGFFGLSIFTLWTSSGSCVV